MKNLLYIWWVLRETVSYAVFKKIFSPDQWLSIVLLELVDQVLLSFATWFVILLKRMVLNVLSISKMQSNIAGEFIWIRDLRTGATGTLSKTGSGDVD